MRFRLRGERGSGSILAVAIIAAVMLMFAAMLPVAAVLSATQRAAGAADAAALTAADVAVGITPGSPCPVAEIVAEANGTRLRGCLLDGTTATVRVSISVLGFTVSARATAGRPLGTPVAPLGDGAGGE